jgi:hypothetical protein
MAFWYMRRFLGRVPLPAQIKARSPGVFKGYINMERGQQAAKALPAGLLTLAQVRTAQLVGCPF